MTQTDDTTDFTALLGSRICHDLISPISAIGNGVELLQMSGAENSPEMVLIAESVADATARIQMFRIAFGSASPSQKLSRREILQTLTDAGRTRGITFDWQPQEDVPRDQARLCFLLIQCCETALMRGGTIIVSLTDTEWHIVAAAEKLRNIPNLWPLLTGDGSEDLKPEQVHFPLARQVADDLGRSISYSVYDERIELSF